MGYMHAAQKGLSQSMLPYGCSIPTWLTRRRDLQTGQERPDSLLNRCGPEGLTWVSQVRFVTGSKILRILKSTGLAPDLPEDLYHLIKKAVAVRKHLERNRKDKDVKMRLILIESRIHRLARYYETKWVLPPD